MNKKNPNRIPCSKADVDRAYSKGQDFGMEFILNVILYVLKDKHNGSNDEILQLRKEFLYVVDSVNEGYLTYADIKNALSGDYDLSVTLV